MPIFPFLWEPLAPCHQSPSRRTKPMGSPQELASCACVWMESSPTVSTYRLPLLHLVPGTTKEVPSVPEWRPSLLSITVNGLRDPVKRVAFSHWILSASPDICRIQESHIASDAEHTSRFSASGYSAFASFTFRHSCALSFLRPLCFFCSLSIPNSMTHGPGFWKLKTSVI